MRIYQTEISNAYIGLQVRKRRLQMGWTAHTLEKSGLSQQQISVMNAVRRIFTFIGSVYLLMYCSVT